MTLLHGHSDWDLSNWPQVHLTWFWNQDRGLFLPYVEENKGRVRKGIFPRSLSHCQSRRGACLGIPGLWVHSRVNRILCPASVALDTVFACSCGSGGSARGWKRIPWLVVTGQGTVLWETNTLTLLRHKLSSTKPLFQWQRFVSLTLSLNYLQKNAFVKFQEMGLITINLHFCTIF